MTLLFNINKVTNAQSCAPALTLLPAGTYTWNGAPPSACLSDHTAETHACLNDSVAGSAI